MSKETTDFQYKIKHVYNVIKFKCKYRTSVSPTHLKAHKSDLSRCNIASTSGHSDARDIVGVAMEESLLSTLQTFNNNSGAQRVNKMLSVRVNFETRKHVSCEQHMWLHLCRFASRLLG